MAFGVSSSVDISRSIVLDLVKDAEAIVAGKNQLLGISLGKEALHSLTGEGVLTREKVQSAFEMAMKHLHVDIGHLPPESQRGAFQFIEDLYGQVLTEYDRLKAHQRVLNTEGAVLALLPVRKPSLRSKCASESQLWHMAIDNFGKGPQLDEEDLSVTGRDVEEGFEDPVIRAKVTNGLLDDMTDWVFGRLVDDTIGELNKMELRDNNCEEKSD
jgi:hypothetical protein